MIDFVISLIKNRNNKNGKRGSDIYEHLKGMRNYSKSESIVSRREEVHDILKAYKDLGIYVKKNQVIPVSQYQKILSYQQ